MADRFWCWTWRMDTSPTWRICILPRCAGSEGHFSCKDHTLGRRDPRSNKESRSSTGGRGWGNSPCIFGEEVGYVSNFEGVFVKQRPCVLMCTVCIVSCNKFSKLCPFFSQVFCCRMPGILCKNPWNLARVTSRTVLGSFFVIVQITSVLPWNRPWWCMVMWV